MRRHYFFRDGDFYKWLKVIKEVKVRINYYLKNPRGLISKEEYAEANMIYQQYKIYLSSLSENERNIIKSITSTKKDSAYNGRFFYTQDMLNNWKEIVLDTNHFKLLEIDISKLGKDIKKSREDTGLYRDEAARLLGISPSTLRSYEDGKRIIRIDVIYKMVQLYGIDLEKLLKLFDKIIKK